MKRVLTLLLAASTYFATAGPNDTTSVTVHNAVDMTWYGNYDVEALLPDGSTSYRQILMHYTMGCASTGCSDWDYTTIIELMDETGVIDSTLRQAPMFRVNGGAPDSVIIAWDTTYTTFYSPTVGTDSTANSPMTIVRYLDTQNPTTPTDTVYGWPANYINYYFDTNQSSQGFRTVPYDTIWFNSFTPYYHYFEVINRIELGRVITPYGGYMRQGSNGFNNNWKHKHTFDVTDYAQFLQDSIKLRAFYSGWSSGFSATVEFEFIEGTPAREVRSVQNLYKGYYTYTDPVDFEERVMPAVKVKMPADADMAKLVVTPTGHGFDNNTSCAEFCPKDYYISIDGSLEHAENMWDDQCAENPIFPQGGTWIYDRANWCPGLRAKIYHHDITGMYTAGDSVEIDFDIEPIYWTGNQNPGYEMSVQLITYGTANFNNDVSVVDVVRPTTKDDYQRFNASCDQPIIKVKNENFSGPITSLEISYGVINGTTETYSWTGYIAPQDVAEIALPQLPFPGGWQGSNMFEVTVSQPNGAVDDNLLNNSMKSTFALADELPNTLIFEFRTNARPGESNWALYNSFGATLFSRQGSQANTTHRDTVYLPFGCYNYSVTDAAQDGLSWPFGSQGTGFLRIKDLAGNTVKSFNPNFGAGQSYSFRTINNVSIEEQLVSDFNVYPNPANELIRISASLSQESDVVLELINILGQVKKTEQLNRVKELNHDWDVSKLPAGNYTLRISSKEGSFNQQLIIQ